MKTRNCFVSNSSSSSFIIMKRDLTNLQVYQIINHEKEAVNYGMSIEEYDAWDVDNKKNSLRLSTGMDNFDIFEFLKRIGVDLNKIIDYENY